MPDVKIIGAAFGIVAHARGLCEGALDHDAEVVVDGRRLGVDRGQHRDLKRADPHRLMRLEHMQAPVRNPAAKADVPRRDRAVNVRAGLPRNVRRVEHMVIMRVRDEDRFQAIHREALQHLVDKIGVCLELSEQHAQHTRPRQMRVEQKLCLAVVQKPRGRAEKRHGNGHKTASFFESKNKTSKPERMFRASFPIARKQ